uniref:TBC1 domain family member 8B n=2 Tax=Anthurium amnicola TaxID=1678845 RepID=A0A1D1YHZ6_9ARAE
MKGKSLPLITFENKRDAYGFAVRPQHLQTYREYANIYKEEEEERSDRWKVFLEQQAQSAEISPNGLLPEEGRTTRDVEGESVCAEDHDTIAGKCEGSEDSSLEREEETKETKPHRIQIWSQIRPSLGAIEHMMCFRVKRKNKMLGCEHDAGRSTARLDPVEEAKSSRVSEEDSEDEFYDAEKSDPVQEPPADSGSADPATSLEPFSAWKEELECLVRGGVPMALRGELWQAFVGARARRAEGYYHDLLSAEGNGNRNKESNSSFSSDSTKEQNKTLGSVPEKWKGQIEKDLPRTFPGHPALDEDGRNALRRLLTAYARHNPSVGYCQAMNFFAGLLLLLMPEENAFWTLVGIIDDYFDGYYSEEMIESQVDQLVFEELVRERFPKLVNHLDYLGVQVAWVTGPWFLSIFVNMLPWESVLRVWDVLLFDGNRVMLFRTALALMELYGPALVTTKDAGDAVTLLQSLAGSTFDSSQLVLTACMGYQPVNGVKLQELRNKHRPAVIAAMEERSKGLRVWKDSQGLASKLYSFKRDPGPLLAEIFPKEVLSGQGNGTDIGSLLCLTEDAELDPVPDDKEQVVWLKAELCKLLEEKRLAVLRSDELEAALMEMVKQDNRRVLSAKVEQLEQEVAELRQALSDKQEQEHAMLQVLMRMEQEQKVTEDARIYAEQEAATQKYAAHVLQEKYEEAMSALAQMEKRAVMAESMLEATLQYQSGQMKAQQPPSPSPRSVQPAFSPGLPNQELSQDMPMRKIGLLSMPFGLGWRDRNKGKPSNAEESREVRPANERGENPEYSG